MKVYTIPVDLLLEVRGRLLRPQGSAWPDPDLETGGAEGLLEGTAPSVRGLKLGRQGRAGFPPDQSRFPSL